MVLWRFIDSEMSLQAIGDELGPKPIKVRKLLITAGVYESEVAEKVQDTFEEYRETQDYKTSILSTANTLKLSKPPSPRTSISERCVLPKYSKKRRSVSEQSGSGDTER